MIKAAGEWEYLDQDRLTVAQPDRATVRQQIHGANGRGDLKDIFSLGSCFESLRSGRFKLIVLDAFYRFMPRDGKIRAILMSNEVASRLEVGCQLWT